MRTNSILLACGLTILLLARTSSGQASDPADKKTGDVPALALVIVYDGSGSMRETVPNVRGERTPKYQLANNAVATIARRMQDYRTNKPVNMEAGLVYFTAGKVKIGIPLQTFDAGTLQNWAQKFNQPDGGTPLGVGIIAANAMLARSHALKKHILIVTDGESNAGESPQSVLARMKSRKEATSVYFVAFDVAAKVFNPVKELGATVVSAANELELKAQIDALLGKRILLEAE